MEAVIKADSMKRYMSKYIVDGNSYKKRVLLPVICVIVSLIIFALAVGYIAVSNLGIKTLQIQWLIAFLLILITTGSTVFLMHVGTNAYRDALIFCLSSDSTLYVIDARNNKIFNKGSSGLKIRFIYHFFKSLVETGKMIDQIAVNDIWEGDLRTGNIKAHVTKIKQINKLQYVSGRRFVECSIVMGDGRTGTWKYDISNHTEELFATLKSLSVSGNWETVRNAYTKQICMSTLCLLVCLGFCIASYPAVGILPDTLYFPSLFVLYIPVIALGIFVLKRRRGE